MSDLSPMFGKKETIPGFNLMEYDNSATPISYIGYQDLRGNWLIKKLDTTTTMVMTYASMGGNSTFLTYADAWADKENLTYGPYESIF